MRTEEKLKQSNVMMKPITKETAIMSPNPGFVREAGEKVISTKRDRQTYFCFGSTVKSIITLWARLSLIGKLKALASFTTSMAIAVLLEALAVSINSSSNSSLYKREQN